MFQKAKITLACFSISLFLAGCSDSLGDRYVGFAECLTAKNVKMYGAYWCPHCANQKKMLGIQAFEKINYIECDPRGENAQPNLCLEKNIRKYPTWEFSDGKMETGEKTTAELAEKTGCELPKESV